MLRKAAADCANCRNCSLYRNATQAVFGQGDAHARVMLVGEQPGNAEDLAGEPFVGPAGALLTEALNEAGLRREKVYVTNAVKHFSFIERGKHRLHKKPTTTEVMACKPWLIEEIGIVRPAVVVALGATAAYSLFGSSLRLTRDRGQVVSRPLPELGGLPLKALLTFHPAAVLRAPTSERRQELRALLVADLALAAQEGRRAGWAEADATVTAPRLTARRPRRSSDAARPPHG